MNVDFVPSSILRIPNGTMAVRYTKIMLAFGLSGLLHYITDITTGITHGQTGSLKFFVVQGLGIMFEDAIQALH